MYSFTFNLHLATVVETSAFNIVESTFIVDYIFITISYYLYYLVLYLYIHILHHLSSAAVVLYIYLHVQRVGVLCPP